MQITVKKGQRWLWCNGNDKSIVEVQEDYTFENTEYASIQCKYVQHIYGYKYCDGRIGYVTNWSFGAGCSEYWSLLEGQDAPQ